MHRVVAEKLIVIASDVSSSSIFLRYDEASAEGRDTGHRRVKSGDIEDGRDCADSGSERTDELGSTIRNR